MNLMRITTIVKETKHLKTLHYFDLCDYFSKYTHVSVVVVILFVRGDLQDDFSLF